MAGLLTGTWAPGLRGSCIWTSGTWCLSRGEGLAVWTEGSVSFQVTLGLGLHTWQGPVLLLLIACLQRENHSPQIILLPELGVAGMRGVWGEGVGCGQGPQAAGRTAGLSDRLGANNRAPTVA